MIAATVLIPTHDHGPLLRHSVQSALDQTISDLEIFIIGDGVPDVTRQLVGELAESDSRIRFFDHPKSPRHGEVYRHQALALAQGEIICYLADDDLWFPDHLEEMTRLLLQHDFVSAFGVGIRPGDELHILPVDLACEFHRRSELEGENRIPLACGAHTRAFYRSVEGWRTTPTGTYTDQYMWQQFLSAPSCRAASSFLPTVLYLSSPYRSGWTPEQRLEELGRWAGRIQDPGWVAEFRTGLLATAMAHWINAEIDLTSARDHLQNRVDELLRARRQLEGQVQAAVERTASRTIDLARVRSALEDASRRESQQKAELEAAAVSLTEVAAELWQLRAMSAVRPLARAIRRVRARRGVR